MVDAGCARADFLDGDAAHFTELSSGGCFASICFDKGVAMAKDIGWEAVCPFRFLFAVLASETNLNGARERVAICFVDTFLISCKMK